MSFSGGVNMKLSSVVKVFGSLCLLSTDGFPVSEDESPEIIGPDCVLIKVRRGKQLILHCDAITNCEDDEALIYWLVNGSFPEDLPSCDRMVESNESTSAEGSILQKTLLLKNVTSEDFKSTFTCVVTNAAGTAQKRITLKAAKWKKH
ncbi:interleukin-1 receptor accessory protein-like [Brachyistius frenatus]|uniref:interleukin-1 receptor accessory protein-like n=1 Tax=Brachyistius frenatus TaxID=100188 RepID=UPI0037E82454